MILQHPSTPAAKTREGYRAMKERMQAHQEMMVRAYEEEGPIFCKPQPKE